MLSILQLNKVINFFTVILSLKEYAVKDIIKPETGDTDPLPGRKAGYSEGASDEESETSCDK